MIREEIAQYFSEKPLWQNTPLKAHEYSVEHFVQHLMQQAVQKKASDIHFERYETCYRIRFRLDGLLHEIASPPLEMADRITAYLKNKANLDTAERRVPQDGRFKLVDIKNLDCRISTCPTVNGEKVVIRLLHASELQRDISELGFNNRQKSLFLKALNQPQGLILVTGPTGSGKTVTLYAALHHLNQAEKNISTVEDPVEIKLTGINQVAVNPKGGLTFAKTIRAFLRQDPDIIMVGEIRDLETAQIAIHASQTGHLVLSTLHANNAVETLTRLADLGVPWFQMASSIQLIIAQRLVRKICCAKRTGCDCHQGYKGRVGLFEILPVTTDLIHAMSLNLSNKTNRNKLIEQAGMISFEESSREAILQGLTDRAEVERVLGKE